MPNPNVTLLTPAGADSLDQSLFARVEQALETLPGPWKVGLSHGEAVGWFVLTVFREDDFECTLLLEGPLQQTAVYIRDRLADALQRHMVGATRPPTRDESRH
jgi:hypothetical protein